MFQFRRFAPFALAVGFGLAAVGVALRPAVWREQVRPLNRALIASAAMVLGMVAWGGARGGDLRMAYFQTWAFLRMFVMVPVLAGVFRSVRDLRLLAWTVLAGALYRALACVLCVRLVLLPQIGVEPWPAPRVRVMGQRERGPLEHHRRAAVRLERVVEQLAGGEIDRRVDVFAMCVVLWEALTSRPMFHGENEAQTISQITGGAYQQPSEIRGDVPKALPMAVELGKGPAIKVKDTGMITDPRIKDWMVARAKAARIPYQLEILRSGTTDAEVIQSARSGIPSGALSLPARYIHSPSEMIDLSDVEYSIKLLLALLAKPIEL